MSDTSITNLTHYLNDSGELADMPGPAMNLALFFCSIVGWVSSRQVIIHERTNVPCRRTPGRKRCLGEIVAGMQADGTVSWHCPICGDRGFIYGWEESRWDRRSG
jgi:hypothetical protein